MKREPRKEFDNLYKERDVRAARRSSGERNLRGKTGFEESDYWERAESDEWEPAHPGKWESGVSEEWEPAVPKGKVRQQKKSFEKRNSERKKERGYREEKQYYYRSLKEHSYGDPAYRQYSSKESSYRDPAYRQYSSRERSFGDQGYEDRSFTEDESWRRAPSQWRETPRYEEGRNRKKKKTGKKAAAVFFSILLILALTLCVIWINPDWRKAAFKAVLTSPVGPVLGEIFLGGSYNQYVKDKDFDKSNIRINEGVSIPKGYRTIALFGIDARAEEIQSGTQADTILILNIDQEGNLEMASILRDTYLMSRNDRGEEVFAKANSAFARGGPLCAVNLLNENFDLAITDYVVVNFWGMANIIDELGGIRMTVTEEERLEMNFHMHEMHVYFNMKDVPLEESGENVLVNGDQATMFCRLRKIPFHSPVDGITYTDDYGRTARQRYVMMSLVSQIREMGMLKLMSASNKLFEANAGEEKFLQSSMDVKELMKWFGLGSSLEITGSGSFPVADHLYTAMLDSGDSVVADTLEENVTLLHEFLYDEKGYEPGTDLLRIAEDTRAEVARQR